MAIRSEAERLFALPMWVAGEKAALYSLALGCDWSAAPKQLPLPQQITGKLGCFKPVSTACAFLANEY